jgi:hypothetical protein
MATLIQRKAHHDNLHSLLTDPAALAEVHTDTEVPEVVNDWLHELKRLKGVPFDYLVPGETYLPKESIRFFQVDPNWIDALVEGAFSIGSATQGDAAHDQVMRAKVESLAPGEVVSGFLLRSEVVRGWPNLGVIVYDANDNVLANIEHPNHLTDTIILVLVSDATALDHVTIHEHPEGLHFGVNIPEHDGGPLTKSLRYLIAPAGQQPGNQIPDGPEVNVPFRPGGKRVIAAAAMADALKSALVTAGAISDPPVFTSAEFALEMIEGVQSVVFQAK